MLTPPGERLLHDHHEVGDLLKQLLAALLAKDLEVSHARLDLFWARLAVHIRAEHLHLFPSVLNRLKESGADAVKLSEAESVVENLRADHDFFMRGLAAAIAVLRDLHGTVDGPEQAARFTSVLDSVQKIEKRLENHNEIEENQIYRWAGTLLTETEQMALAKQINAELEHRPPRFTLEAWANDE